MIGLIDCNNFYVSCERIFRPDLIGKPVIVLSNNDGCVIARSEEAKELGIPMGAPVFQYKELIEKNNVIIFSPNFNLYGDISWRVMYLLTEKCPNIEIYSIDEAFIDITHQNVKNIYEFGLSLKKYIYKCVGIPISIGFASTKVLAKAANKIAKKFTQKTKGVYVIDNEWKKKIVLRYLSVEDIWGIGKKYTELLNKNGIFKAIDFVKLPDEWIKKNMTINGLKIKYELLGIKCLELEDEIPKKSISVSRSFHNEITNIKELKERISLFIELATQKLRNQKSLCSTIIMYYHTNYFNKREKPIYQQVTIFLDTYTNCPHYIAKKVNKILEKNFINGIKIKKAGIILTNLISQEYNIPPLFTELKHEEQIKLMKTIDEINSKYGRFTIHLAAHNGNIRHKTLCEHLSPCYTTNWSDIIRVKV